MFKKEIKWIKTNLFLIVLILALAVKYWLNLEFNIDYKIFFGAILAFIAVFWGVVILRRVMKDFKNQRQIEKSEIINEINQKLTKAKEESNYNKKSKIYDKISMLCLKMYNLEKLNPLLSLTFATLTSLAGLIFSCMNITNLSYYGDMLFILFWFTVYFILFVILSITMVYNTLE